MLHLRSAWPDPSREFWRVVAMDTDEFWHPVELAR